MHSTYFWVAIYSLFLCWLDEKKHSLECVKFFGTYFNQASKWVHFTNTKNIFWKDNKANSILEMNIPFF